jgi:dienelactone hydrolase
MRPSALVAGMGSDESVGVVQTASIAHRAPLHLHVPHLLIEIGRVVVAGLDGLLVGLTVGFVLLTAVGAPANHVGLPWPVEIVATGVAVSGVALVGAVVALGVFAAIAWIGRHLTKPLASSGHRRLAVVVGLPFRLLAAMPWGWIGAFAVLLWIALVGRTTGPLGLLTPPGVLSSFVYLAGVVGVLVAVARAVLLPRDLPIGVGPGPARRLIGGGVAVAAAAVLVGAAAFAWYPGTTAGLVAYDPTFDGDPATATAAASIIAGSGAEGTTAIDDPGAPGPYTFERWSYGSGVDTRRPAFGVDAARITPTVDASEVLRPLPGGADEVRALWWGFGTNELPLDALVWAPVGAGPFPLVLIVHGNHAMGEFSEDGYAYLGEHLASQGFIVASIDEDFLNGSWAGDWEGDEQVVRAWLLLLHADLWRSWNADPTDSFHGRVDLDRIALVGHSRGGEASAVAAGLAGADIAPRASMTPWPTDLRIHAVVAIAPSDGQYAAAVRLDGVDYLTITGGHDADARAWAGIRQYARTTVADGGFKAALWAYRANHGQFNTVWGRGDFGPMSGAQLNLAPLLPAADQEDVARTSLGAFLEASLHDNEAYRGFFARPMLGREWLPEDIFLVRSSEGGVIPLTTADSATPVTGVTVETEGFTSVGSMHVPLRAILPDQATRAVIARWALGDGDATWTVRGLDAAVADRTAATTLRFALADGTRTDEGPTPSLRIVVEAIVADGTTVALPLEEVGALPPPLSVQLAKHDAVFATSGIDIHLESPAERVLQTYAIPLGLFEAIDPDLSASDVVGFRLRIDRAHPGAIWIRDVGLGG